MNRRVDWGEVNLESLRKRIINSKIQKVKHLDISQLFRLDVITIFKAQKIKKELELKYELMYESKYAFDNLNALQYTPVLLDLQEYFNFNILSIYGVLKTSSGSKKNKKTFEHNLDNLLLRIQCLWEYIYQYINDYFELELALTYEECKIWRKRQKQIRNDKAKIKQSILELKQIKDDDYNRDKIFSLEQALRFKDKEIACVSKYNICQEMKRKYDLVEGSKYLLNIITSNEYDSVRRIRNQVAHYRSASANSSIDSMFLYNGTKSVSINKAGWIDKADILISIEKELLRLREALNYLYTILYTSDFPNLKENAGKTYFFVEMVCCNCGDSIKIPDSFVENSSLDKKTYGYCYECGIVEVDFKQMIPLNEKHYEQMLIKFIKNM